MEFVQVTLTSRRCSYGFLGCHPCRRVQQSWPFRRPGIRRRLAENAHPPYVRRQGLYSGLVATDLPTQAEVQEEIVAAVKGGVRGDVEVDAWTVEVHERIALTQKSCRQLGKESCGAVLQKERLFLG